MSQLAPAGTPAPQTEPSEATPSARAPDGPETVSLREAMLGTAQRMFLLFALYVLSIGPMYWTWYESRYVDGSLLVAAFYEPLVRLARWIPPFGEWLDWYVDLWIV